MKKIIVAVVFSILATINLSDNDLSLVGKALAAKKQSDGFASDYFNIVEIGKGLNHPWGMDFLPNGDALITERSGGLKLLSGGTLVDIEHNLPVVTFGQGGLLDVAVAPDFAKSHEVYFSFSAKIKNGVGTKIASAKLSGKKIIDVHEIFAMDSGGQGGRHFGSRLLFANDGSLFATIGDRGQRHLAQKLNYHHGSIIRIHRDGSIPKDNPFVGQRNTYAQIYSYGHRNPQGLAWQPNTDVLFSSEFGPKGGDEINSIEKGNNYGWPIITYGKEYFTSFDIGEGTEAAGMQQPLVYWTPSISPSGIAFYKGDKFPQWQGDLFVATLSAQHLRRVRFDKNNKVSEQQVLLPDIGRIRDVTIGPEGYFWLLLDSSNTPLIKLTPK